MLSKGHDFDNWQIEKQQTCTEDGIIIRVCKVCDEKESDIISHTGHKFGEAVITKEATETEDGLKTATCTVCGETKEEVIPSYSGTTEIPSEDVAIDTPKGNEDNKNNYNILWIIIAIGAVVIAGATTTIILIKKKRHMI